MKPTYYNIILYIIIYILYNIISYIIYRYSFTKLRAVIFQNTLIQRGISAPINTSDAISKN
jgi:hypothetical protein